VELPFLPKLITASGVVAGTNETRRAVVWRQAGGLESLSVPEGFHYTDPVGFTKSGDVIVNAMDIQSKKRRAFFYSKQSMLALTGNQTWAHASDPSGIIVGEWVLEGSARTEPVYWDQEKRPHSIKMCCGGVITGVNKAGDMIGNAYDNQGRYHAFVWSPSQGQRTLGPIEDFSSALAINAAGHILFTAGKETYLVRDGRSQPLKLSPKLDNSAQAINNCDFVVGGFGPFSDSYRAFLWTEKAGFHDLNSFIPHDLGWTLEIAAAINDRGEIVGQGELHGDDRGFLLIPKH
jgi:probable HAF family extracellular repeat protein